MAQRRATFGRDRWLRVWGAAATACMVAVAASLGPHSAIILFYSAAKSHPTDDFEEGRIECGPKRCWQHPFRRVAFRQSRRNLRHLCQEPGQPGYPKYQIGSMKLKPQIHDHERIGSYSSKVTSPQPYLHLTLILNLSVLYRTVHKKYQKYMH